MAQLEKISNELFEMVVAQLDLKTICSLRLVNHKISAKTNQKTFQSFFRNIRICLTLDNLKAFHRATKFGLFGRCVKNLTLVGVVYDLDQLKEIVCKGFKHEIYSYGGRAHRWIPCPEDKLSQAKQDLAQLQRQRANWICGQVDGAAVALLRSALDHINDHSSCLERFSFDVQVVAPKLPDGPSSSRTVGWYNDRSWRISMGMIKTASEVLLLGLAALQRSRLKQVDALDIYGSAAKSISPGIPIDMLSDILDRSATGLGSVFSCVRSLSITFTHPRLAIHRRTGADYQSELKLDADINSKLHEDGPFFGLTQLLLACCNVEDLSITHYSDPAFTADYRTTMYCDHGLISRQIRHLIKHAKLPRLRNIRLERVNLKDDDLAELLLGVRDSLEKLELISLHVEGMLTTGLAPITDGVCPRVDCLLLQGLLQNFLYVTWDQRQLDQAAISVDEEGSPKKYSTRRYGKDVRRPLFYSLETPDYGDEDECTLPLSMTFD